MARVPVFFISSTTHDLGSYRDAAAQALRDRELQVVVMNHFPPDHRQLREMLRKKIAPCDAVVCLIGFHYGAEPPDGTAPRRSYTQWEYFIARELKKQVYLLFAQETTAWDNPLVEPEEVRQRQLDFRNDLARSGQRRDSFSNREHVRDLALRIPAPGSRAAIVWSWLGALVAVAFVLVWTKPWNPRHTLISGGPSPPEKKRTSVLEASKTSPFINSLGMRFVPLPGIQNGEKLLSIWETRNADWAAVGMRGGRPSSSPNEPVCGVRILDAMEFYKLLTEGERAGETIPAGWIYRLPTADEWSAATQKSDGSLPEFPWGDGPPSEVVANLRGTESLVTSRFPNDGHGGLAPVGSFAANANGFHDLAGNAWEICTQPGERPIVRGGGWGNSQEAVFKMDHLPEHSDDFGYAEAVGFRCLLVRE